MANPNQTLYAFSNKLAKGRCEDRNRIPYRKIKVPIRRDLITEVDNPTIPPTTPCQAYLFASQLWKSIGVRQNTSTMRWNDLDTFFFGPQRKAAFEARSRLQFENFSVQIPSLLYLGYPDINVGNTLHQLDKATEFIVGHQQRQLGAHLYLSRDGSISVVILFKRANENRYTNVSQASVSNIYPVIRYEWQHPQREGGTFLFGLRYNNVNQQPNGSRYYHRFGDQKLQRFAVFELENQFWQQINAAPPQPRIQEQTFSILYVCVGAKLVIIDSFLERINPNKEQHNRTLIQQGGIVICQGPLYISIPVMAEGQQPCDQMGFRMYTWTEFHQHLRKENGQAPDVIPDEPVLFLGAQNSLFNTITWYLNVQGEVGSQRRNVLMVTNSARFNAIEGLVDGINEIRARIQYEMLHDSVVTNHGTTFNRGERDMARRIIDPGSQRVWTVNQNFNENLVPNTNVTNLPKEFNISMPLEAGFDTNFNNFHANQTSRLAAPPMYPMIEKVAPDQWYYIPNYEFPNWKHIDPKYYHRNKDIYFKSNTHYFKYVQMTKDAFHYTKMANKIGVRQMRGQITDAPNYRFCRVGVDGYVWQVVPNHQKIYSETIDFFQKTEIPINSPDMKKLHIQYGIKPEIITEFNDKEAYIQSIQNYPYRFQLNTK